jgi:AraC-like DNA-binding protein
LETGADDFLIKPFDGEELQIRVENLVAQRKKMHNYFLKRVRKSGAVVDLSFEDSGVTSMDEHFLTMTVSRVAEKYADPEFNVENLGKDLGMSRMQFYRKFRALTGKTAVEFIRSYRLHRAGELLVKQAGTVAEIGYDVGFSSPSYFSKCFKEEFGVLPLDYVKQNT